MAKYLHGYKLPGVTPRQIRQQIGVSNARMAQLLGVCDYTWLAWQSGRRIPSAAAERLMMLLLWLDENNQLSTYWTRFAEPKILRNYRYEKEPPGALR
jgi:transcriptional regulator with XRE-family HTH domain